MHYPKIVWGGGIAVSAMLVAAGVIFAQQSRPLSPRGSSEAHVLGTWNASKQTDTAGGTYENGKWLEISFGRPIKRGRDLFGSGAAYGKSLLAGAPLWRAGANVSTILKNEVPLTFAGTAVPPGEYTVFIDLKEGNWTFILSRWPAQQTYDPNNKTALWGAYNYTPDKDVVRTKMTLGTLAHSQEQLSWEFVDVTAKGGALAIAWDRTQATVPFTF